MFQPQNHQWILWVLTASLLALVVYFILYPFRVIAFFSILTKKKRKSKDDVLAVPVRFRIRIWFDKNATDKSSLIDEIKRQLKNLAEKNSDVSISHANDLNTSPDSRQNIRDSYIPDDDQSSLNPANRIDEGPEAREEEGQDDNETNTAGYVRLKDL